MTRRSSPWRIPRSLTLQQAAALALDGGTALHGLKGILQLSQNDTIMIIGASGGIGHMAIQIAKRLGPVSLPLYPARMESNWRYRSVPTLL